MAVGQRNGSVRLRLLRAAAIDQIAASGQSEVVGCSASQSPYGRDYGWASGTRRKRLRVRDNSQDGEVIHLFIIH